MAKSDATHENEQQLAAQLEAELLNRYGPMMGGKDLHRALGYRSAVGFRSALSRQQVFVTVFNLAHRRGKFALTKDIAVWLAKQPQGASQPEQKGAPPMKP
ncbi:MAG TPA: hypothetical protein DHV21_05590 [Curvibacter sp.]|nr:hypothetical protein [Curvibacter sp.]